MNSMVPSNKENENGDQCIDFNSLLESWSDKGSMKEGPHSCDYGDSVSFPNGTEDADTLDISFDSIDNPFNSVQLDGTADESSTCYQNVVHSNETHSSPLNKSEAVNGINGPELNVNLSESPKGSEMKNGVMSYRSVVAELKEQNKELQRLLEESRKELEAVCKERDALKQCQKSEKEIEEVMLMNESLKFQLKQYEEHIKILDDSKDERKFKFNMRKKDVMIKQMQNKLDEMESKCSTRALEVSNLEKQLAVLKVKCSENSQEKEELGNKCKALEQDLHRRECERRELLESYNAIGSEVERKNRECAELISRCNDLESEKVQWEHQLKQYQEHIKNVDGPNNEIEKLKSDIRKKDMMSEQIRRKLDIIKGESIIHASEVSKLKKEWAVFEGSMNYPENIELAKKCKTLEQDLHIIQDGRKELLERYKALGDMMESKNQEILILRTRYDIMEAEKNRREHQENENFRRCENMRDKIKELESDLEKQKLIVKDRDQIIVNLCGELDEAANVAKGAPTSSIQTYSSCNKESPSKVKTDLPISIGHSLSTPLPDGQKKIEQNRKRKDKEEAIREQQKKRKEENGGSSPTQSFLLNEKKSELWLQRQIQFWKRITPARFLTHIYSPPAFQINSFITTPASGTGGLYSSSRCMGNTKNGQSSAKTPTEQRNAKENIGAKNGKEKVGQKQNSDFLEHTPVAKPLCSTLERLGQLPLETNALYFSNRWMGNTKNGQSSGHTSTRQLNAEKNVGSKKGKKKIGQKQNINSLEHTPPAKPLCSAPEGLKQLPLETNALYFSSSCMGNTKNGQSSAKKPTEQLNAEKNVGAKNGKEKVEQKQNTDFLEHTPPAKLLCSALERLEQLPFEKLFYKKICHTLECVLRNPAAVPSSEFAVYTITQFLCTSKRNPLLSYVLSRDPSLLTPFIESAIAEVLMSVDRLRIVHLDNLLETFMQTVCSTVLENKRLQMLAVGALCRTYTIICRMKERSVEARFLAHEILRHRRKLAYHAVASMAGIWEDILKNNSDMVVQKMYNFILCRKPSNLKFRLWQECYAVFNMRGLMSIDDQGIESVVSEVVDLLFSKDTGCKVDEYKRALEVLLVQADWTWVRRSIIKIFACHVASIAKDPDKEILLMRAFDIICSCDKLSPAGDNSFSVILCNNLAFLRKNPNCYPFSIIEKYYLSLCEIHVNHKSKTPDWLNSWLLANMDKLSEKSITWIKNNVDDICSVTMKDT